MSDIGLTEKEFRQQAIEAGINEPMKVFDWLLSLELVRVQDRSEEGRENCLKATKKAFTLVENQ